MNSITVNLTNSLNADTTIDTEEAAQDFARRFGEENLAQILRDADDWTDTESYLDLLARASAIVSAQGGMLILP